MALIVITAEKDLQSFYGKTILPQLYLKIQKEDGIPLSDILQVNRETLSWLLQLKPMLFSALGTKIWHRKWL